MSAVALWSRTLKAGESTTFEQSMPIRITSASFDETVDVSSDASKNRGVVKITYHQIAFNEDSDEEDEESPKKEEDGETTAVLCHLFAGRVEHQVLDFYIPVETEITLKNTGSNTISLLGNVIEEEDVDQPPYDSDFDEEDDEDALMADLDDEDDGGRFEELEDEIEKLQKPKAIEAKKSSKPESKKADAAKPTSAPAAAAAPAAKPESKKRPAPESDGEGSGKAEGGALSKNQRKKLAKKLKAEGGEAAAPPAGAAKAATNGGEKKDGGKKNKNKGESEKTLPSGLKIIDSKEGDGEPARKGKMIHVRYIGKLDNGKVFDKNTAGEPFKFRLGAGEVIKGWDTGFEGMKVGGERKLVIPPQLAYGKRKTGDIPANSTLTFDVKLLKIR
ncbi:hypothetical protein BT69DRAFT_1243173 [Atractiella rhizophila]|nr:hypothetical protein BT69DRAFT_1243173 [Atractiella rhizophila]